MCFSFLVLDSSLIPTIDWFNSPIIFGIPLNLPLASKTETPRSCKAFLASVGGAESLVYICLKLVPAIEPWIPTSPSFPAKAETSLKPTPRPEAIGAVYFIVSPSITRSVFEVEKVLAKISDTIPIFSALMEKPLKIFEPISLAVAKSTLPAVAKPRTPLIAPSCCLALKPALAR